MFEKNIDLAKQKLEGSIFKGKENGEAMVLVLVFYL